MPWQETDVQEERMQFIHDWQRYRYLYARRCGHRTGSAVRHRSSIPREREIATRPVSSFGMRRLKIW